MTTHSSACPLDCPDACSILIKTNGEGEFVSLRGDPASAHTAGVLCGKTALYGELINSSERLTSPLVRNSAGQLESTSWELALDRIASELDGLEGRDILALDYAGNMGLITRKFPMRVMNALGADQHNGGICDNTGAAGYEIVYGRPVGPDIEELQGADAVVVWGADLKRTMPHVLPHLRDLCRAGRPVIAIDVYRTDTLRALERWGGRGLVVKPGSDAALALSLARLAFERGWADRKFLEVECVGAQRFEEHLKAAPSIEAAASHSGLSVGDIELLGETLASAREPFVKLGVGWTRRRNGGSSMRAVLSLAAVLGIARRVHFESVGVFGIDGDLVTRPDLRPPGTERKPVTQIELGDELTGGRYRACFVWGHNPAMTLPNSIAVRRGLARDDLFLCVHEQFLTETAQLADVVLPAATFVEQADLLRSYGHRHLQPTQRACKPPGNARGNVDAFAAIAKRLGLPSECVDVSAESLRDEVIENSACFSAEQRACLKRGESIKLEPPSGWSTPSGKIELYSARAVDHGAPPMATFQPDDHCDIEGAFQLICAPSKATHNSTFCHSSRHMKRAGSPRVYVNPDDAQASGLGVGCSVRLRNALGALTLLFDTDEDMPRGLLRIDGLPRAEDFPEGVGINALVPGVKSDLGDGNVLYSTRVDMDPVR